MGRLCHLCDFGNQIPTPSLVDHSGHPRTPWLLHRRNSQGHPLPHIFGPLTLTGRSLAQNNSIFSENHFQKQFAILRGTCLGTTAPVQVTSLTSLVSGDLLTSPSLLIERLGMDESAVLKYISELIQGEELCGVCTAKEYVPETFQHSQRLAVDDFFKLHGLVELNQLIASHGVRLAPSSCTCDSLLLIVFRSLASSSISSESLFQMLSN
jgi:hypothetical protein